ncbi:MAG: hypothetical protein GY694_00960 [Gammaproteobacteria bacterium]|nr:hypothetical protein [Gammaproteobacteria bacterium]
MTITTSSEAINRVLFAEKEARQEVDLCRHKAALIIMDGRDRVRRIINRADERIMKVHSIADQITEQKLADFQINTALLSQNNELNEKMLANVDKAIELLIAELIGKDHE